MQTISGWIPTSTPEQWLKDQSLSLPHQLISHWGSPWVCEIDNGNTLNLSNPQVCLTIDANNGTLSESVSKQNSPTPINNDSASKLSSIDRYGLVDSEGKQRVRLYFLSYTHLPNQLFLLSQSMKGYENNHQKFIKAILTRSDFFFTPTTALQAPYEEGSLTLPSLQETDHKLWNLINDVDIRRSQLGRYDNIELLHKFRVSVRRTRSYLGHTRFSNSLLDKQLKRLMKTTNHLRDMDVFIENKKQLVKQVDHALQPELIVFFKLVEKNHHLNQIETFKEIRNSTPLSRVLSDSQLQPKRDSIQQTVEPEAISSEQISRLRQQCVKRINTLSATSADNEVHQLRIKIKQLRYLIEMLFEELSPQYQGLLKTLKPLQEHLGIFNDRCIQQETLADLVTKLKANKHQRKSVKALIKQLGKIAQRQKIQLVNELQQFSQQLKTL